MADFVLEFSTDASGLDRNVILDTPDKEDSQTYSQTPVSSVIRPSKTSSENNKNSTASEHAIDPSSYSAESRAKFYQKRDLDKIRVSLFHDMEQKNQTKASIFPVNATSFYGNNVSRYLPLAPNILGTVNQKIDKCKSNSPSLYDFPNKRVTRKRKGGGINSGVGHGIKKLKSKANSIKHESPEVDEDTIMEKKCLTSQKENVVEVENSQIVEDYNPNNKFFKYKRSVILQIDLGKKQRSKKNVKQEETVVNYSNVFDSLNSKKRFHKQLNSRGRRHLNSEAESPILQSPVLVKIEIFDQNKQYQQVLEKLPAIRSSIVHHSSNSQESNNVVSDTENEVDTGTNQELPYQNLAMDIENNNNFSNNEIMIDDAVHNDEELKRQLTVGNDLYFMQNLTADDSSEQNISEIEGSSNNGKLICSSGSEQYQKNVRHRDVKNIQCQKCHYLFELGNKTEETAHSNYHSDFCNKQLEELSKDDSMEITIGTDSIIIVKPFSPKSHREKAFDVLRFIKAEMNLSDHDLVDNQTKHFFMYIRERSIVGVLVAETLESAFRSESNSSLPYRLFSEKCPVKCGINIIWVTQSLRRQGIATKMMGCLQNRFCSNYNMDVNDIAFSIPTTSGRYFVEKYVGSRDFNVF